jgi:hypothetical protein
MGQVGVSYGRGSWRSASHRRAGAPPAMPVRRTSARTPTWQPERLRYGPLARISHRPGIDTSVDAANTGVCATPAVNSLFARNRGARSQRAVPALLPACLGRELMRNPG